jgi:hypothetical protein
MTCLDPFLIYTIRLVIQNKPNKMVAKHSFPIANILTIKSWPTIQFDKPKLSKGNLLSLLYHAGKNKINKPVFAYMHHR